MTVVRGLGSISRMPVFFKVRIKARKQTSAEDRCISHITLFFSN